MVASLMLDMYTTDGNIYSVDRGHVYYAETIGRLSYQNDHVNTLGFESLAKSYFYLLSFIIRRVYK